MCVRKGEGGRREREREEGGEEEERRDREMELEAKRGKEEEIHREGVTRERWRESVYAYGWDKYT